MSFELYNKDSGGLELSPTLRAMLTENGEHVFRLAFDRDTETPRNFFFGVVVTPAALDLDACLFDDSSRQCLHVCYELCESFPLCEGGEEHARLELSMQRILEVPVRLLPFTTFQRSIGQYPALLELFQEEHYCGMFRKDTGSLLDLKMHVVLSCWQRTAFACQPEPPELRERATPAVDTSVVPRDEWNTCFHSISRVLWYHAYVYELLGEEVRDGYSLCNVLRTHDAVCAKGGANVPGKLALLDVLKLVYRYNYSVA